MTSRRSQVPGNALPRKSVESTITFTITDAAEQFRTHLRSRLLSPETVASYLTAVTQAGALGYFIDKQSGQQ